jgi:hypothetical protein
MEKEHNFKLIDGEFSPSEAKNVLFALVNSKINFHAMESFGITERTSGDTSFHENRIMQLTQTNKDIRELMAYANENNLRLKIDGIVKIKFINE